MVFVLVMLLILLENENTVILIIYLLALGSREVLILMSYNINRGKKKVNKSVIFFLLNALSSRIIDNGIDWGKLVYKNYLYVLCS